jgi:hypothetical protein
MNRAERMVLVGVLFVIFGVFLMMAYPIIGVLWIAFFAVPTIVYGVYAGRQSQNKGALPFGEQATTRKDKLDRSAQETYQDLLIEFARSFGAARGSLLLENRIKAYMKEGLNREEAVRRFAEDEGY